jgi:hypothetical protein
MGVPRESPVTTATVNTKTLANGLISVYTALTLNTRADGSSYRMISETHPDREAVLSIVYDLHDDELPNDWRYETIYRLATSLLEYSDGSDPEDCEPWGMAEYMDLVPCIAAGLVDGGKGDLLEWAKIGSRTEFWDAFESILAPDVVGLLQTRQREEIQLMGYNLLTLVEEQLT